MEDAWIPLRTYISVTLAHDSSDEPSNYHETLCLHLQNECVRHALPLPKLHIPLVRNRENKVSPPWFYKMQKNLPSTAKQVLATTLIDSFQRSMGKDDSVSHPESKVWSESFEITLMHTLSHEPRLCFILRICFDSFCSGRAKSRYGGVLAVVFSDFYCQHSFGFQAPRTIMHRILLTLTSSMSFGALLISGT